MTVFTLRSEGRLRTTDTTETRVWGEDQGSPGRLLFPSLRPHTLGDRGPVQNEWQGQPSDNPTFLE